MQEDLDLKVSMLVDGELDPAEAIRVLDEIRQNPQLRAKWNRYNAASLSMKSHSKVFPDATFFDKVSQVLESEPVILNPSRSRKKASNRFAYAAALAASFVIVGFFAWSMVPKEFNQSPIEPILSTVETYPANVQLVNQLSVPRRLNDYLITHNESAYQSGGQNILSYARVVSYSTEK